MTLKVNIHIFGLTKCTIPSILAKAIPLFFSFSVKCVSWYWVSRSDWKKKLKKNHKKSRNRRPWYPRMTLKVNIHIFGLTKCAIYCKKMSLFLFLFFYMLLLCSFFRLKELFQVKNGLTTFSHFLIFFWNMPKIWVGRTTLNREKKEDGLMLTSLKGFNCKI